MWLFFSRWKTNSSSSSSSLQKWWHRPELPGTTAGLRLFGGCGWRFLPRPCPQHVWALQAPGKSNRQHASRCSCNNTEQLKDTWGEDLPWTTKACFHQQVPKLVLTEPQKHRLSSCTNLHLKKGRYLTVLSWAILLHLFKLYLRNWFSKWNWKKVIISFKTCKYTEVKSNQMLEI